LSLPLVRDQHRPPHVHQRHRRRSAQKHAFIRKDQLTSLSMEIRIPAPHIAIALRLKTTPPYKR
jgi:hypothetical protein